MPSSRWINTGHAAVDLSGRLATTEESRITCQHTTIASSVPYHTVQPARVSESLAANAHALHVRVLYGRDPPYHRSSIPRPSRALRQRSSQILGVRRASCKVLCDSKIGCSP